MTECSQAEGECDLVATCGVADNWQRVSLAIRTLLESVTLAHLADTDANQATRTVTDSKH